jgi:signal transduction histidine kinase
MVCFYIVEVAKKTVDPTAKKLAIISGAVTLGCSVWAMHFIGMLALRICAPVRYDIPITVISLLPSMFASFLAFNLFLNKEVTTRRLIVSGALVGAGIGAMHYTGMQAMIMAPSLRYQVFWFVISVIVAIVLSILSLGIAGTKFSQKLKPWQRIAICGTVLGCAVCFMHYAGMKAALFIGTPVTPIPIAPEGSGTLAIALTLGMMFISFNGIGLNLIKHKEIAQIALKENEELQALITKLQETQQQLLQSEKMASVGQLAAGVAHEINNPIGFINSNVNSLQRYVTTLFDVITQYRKLHAQLPLSEEKLTAIAQIEKDSDLDFIQEDIHNLLAESVDGLKRVKEIVQSLKDFAHVDVNEWAEADIHQGIDSTLNIARNEIKYKATIKKNYGELPPVYCIIAQLNQVFMNLFINAAHAIHDQGTITISTGVETKEEGDWVWIKIQDTGSGISPENLIRIFDPFFTTKPVGSGTGLGLSLAYGIIESHCGRILVDSEVGKGTCFTIHLPVHRKLIRNRLKQMAA